MRNGVEPRLAVVPGLDDSGPTHWQSWLQGQVPGSVRVVQRDWQTPDLARWAARVAAVIERAGHGPWLIAAHSFGCLATVQALSQRPDLDVRAVLLVAPAEPAKFGLAEPLPQRRLRVPGLLVASQTDPWMRADSAARWAQRWGCHHVNLGDAGHINAAAGFGPLPLARRWVQAQQRRHAAALRPRHAAWAEWSFAV